LTKNFAKLALGTIEDLKGVRPRVLFVFPPLLRVPTLCNPIALSGTAKSGAVHDCLTVNQSNFVIEVLVAHRGKNVPV
jgi:hypothetical protein